MSVSGQRLRELLHYDPETGVFVWRIPTRCGTSGAVAGSLKPTGYVRIRVDRHFYSAHRLAWLYVHDSWPPEDIDHIDGNPSNNRLGNLRAVSRSVNMQNQRKAPATSSSGLLGVTWFRPLRKWKAQIHVKGKNHHLGYFISPEVAHAAYVEAKRRLHPGNTL